MRYLVKLLGDGKCLVDTLPAGFEQPFLMNCLRCVRNLFASVSQDRQRAHHNTGNGNRAPSDDLSTPMSMPTLCWRSFNEHMRSPVVVRSFWTPCNMTPNGFIYKSGEKQCHRESKLTALPMRIVSMRFFTPCPTERAGRSLSD